MASNEILVKEALIKLFNAYVDAKLMGGKASIPKEEKSGNPILSEIGRIDGRTVKRAFLSSNDLQFSVYALAAIIKDKGRLCTPLGCKFFTDILEAFVNRHGEDENVKGAFRYCMADKYCPDEYPDASRIMGLISHVIEDGFVLGNNEMALGSMLSTQMGVLFLEKVAEGSPEAVSVFEQIKEELPVGEFFRDQEGVISLNAKPRMGIGGRNLAGSVSLRQEDLRKILKMFVNGNSAGIKVLDMGGTRGSATKDKGSNAN